MTFIASIDGALLGTWPAETLDFDASGVPQPVADALKEAVVCHSQGCYVAAAIMVRRTIEEMCHEQGATGGTLYDRIEALAETIVLPKPFRDALHDVRLLGNDAAHIEARSYNAVGEEEVRAGITVAKRLLQATYQYDDLMAELAKLKRIDPT